MASSRTVRAFSRTVMATRKTVTTKQKDAPVTWNASQIKTYIFLNTSDALCPPKPSELLIAYVMSALRAPSVT